MLKSIFLSGLLAMAIAVPAQSQTRRMVWEKLADGVAIGLDLNSVEARQNNSVKYEVWTILDETVTQFYQLGTCDGTNLIAGYGIRQWDNNTLVLNQTNNAPIRTAKSYDASFLVSACGEAF